jgi:hypothetical protein
MPIFGDYLTEGYIYPLISLYIPFIFPYTMKSRLTAQKIISSPYIWINIVNDSMVASKIISYLYDK